LILDMRVQAGVNGGLLNKIAGTAGGLKMGHGARSRAFYRNIRMGWSMPEWAAGLKNMTIGRFPVLGA